MQKHFLNCILNQAVLILFGCCNKFIQITVLQLVTYNVLLQLEILFIFSAEGSHSKETGDNSAETSCSKETH